MKQNFIIYYLIVSGIVVGLTFYGIYISRVFSYLSDDPAACVNCHIMSPHYASWYHSSHREHATCNDCHIPHDNKIRGLWFKINDGLRHSTIFTFGGYPQVIRIRESGQEVVQENCLRCHSHQLSFVSIFQTSSQKPLHQFHRKCWECHREVPHGRISSQASTPFARVPIETDILPSWLKKHLIFMNKKD